MIRVFGVAAAVLAGLTGGAAQAQSGDMPPEVAAGKALYEVNTVGGFGCIPCHGAEGKGGRDGPNITGQSVENIRIQLEANESMTFILLDDAEFAQVSAYLKWVVGLY